MNSKKKAAAYKIEFYGCEDSCVLLLFAYGL